VERRIGVLHERLDELLRDERTADAAWSQLLYEGLVEGLGYAKNKRSFRELAQNLPLKMLRRSIGNESDAAPDTESDTIMALLFGAAGLLPPSRGLRERESRRYVLRLRKRWRAFRQEIRSPLLHEADWLFFRLRPVNFPTARLALLGHLAPRMLEECAAQRMLNCIRTSSLTSRERGERLHQFLSVLPDTFWRSHLHFRAAGPGPSIALGTDRIDAIIFNTFIPVAMLYARLFDERTLYVQARALARTLPAPPPNSVIRVIEQRLVRSDAAIDSALTHHGAIEFYRTRCERGRCKNCPVTRQRGGLWCPPTK
jgi:hypothetical protein